MEKNKPKQKNGKEPVFIVKGTRMGGLDYLHIALIALVIILIAFSFELAVFKKGVILENCPYGIINNSTCAPQPINSSNASSYANVIDAAGKILASYSSVNTSLSILPYISLINDSKVSFMPSLKEWEVVVPYKDILDENKTFNLSFILFNNLTLDNSFISTLKPAKYTDNKVVSLGVVSLSGKYLCNYTTPIPVDFMIDPYTPGFINYTYNAINISKSYGAKLNMSYNFLFSGYSTSLYRNYGVSATQRLGDYLVCASKQPRFKQFISNLSIIYNNKPIENSTLYQMVLGSGLNTTKFDQCMTNASVILDNQARFAAFYNITSLPSYVIDCKYQTIPQTANYAINYTLNKISK